MSKPLVIVVSIEANVNHIDLVKTELLKLVEITRKEAGCIQYDLHQDNNAPEVFLLFEKWESRELWEAHADSAHVRNYLLVTENAVDNFTMYEMSVIT